MSPEAQRVAIAEACGYDCTCLLGGDEGRVFAVKNGRHELLPDYLNDLNATHEAEKALTDEQRGLFAGHLEELCAGNLPAFFATAAQRAEAFLRTLGKWEDTK